MAKPTIKTINRQSKFYTIDMRSIGKRGDWKELTILHDAAYPVDEDYEYGDDEVDDAEFMGEVVCWNEKEQQIEILIY